MPHVPRVHILTFRPGGALETVSRKIGRLFDWPKPRMLLLSPAGRCNHQLAQNGGPALIPLVPVKA